MYVTPTDLAQLYDAEEIAQLVGAETDRVERACEMATNIVDSYTSRYPQPLSARNAEVVKPYAAAIARWFLHQHSHPEPVEQAREHAIAWLKDVASGKASLPESGATAGEVGILEVQSNPRMFSRRTLGGL
jgi:phage gp36-like protein